MDSFEEANFAEKSLRKPLILPSNRHEVTIIPVRYKINDLTANAGNPILTITLIVIIVIIIIIMIIITTTNIAVNNSTPTFLITSTTIYSHSTDAQRQWRGKL